MCASAWPSWVPRWWRVRRSSLTPCCAPRPCVTPNSSRTRASCPNKASGPRPGTYSFRDSAQLKACRWAQLTWRLVRCNSWRHAQTFRRWRLRKLPSAPETGPVPHGAATARRSLVREARLLRIHPDVLQDSPDLYALGNESDQAGAFGRRTSGTAAQTPRRCGQSKPPTGSAPVSCLDGAGGGNATGGALIQRPYSVGNAAW